MLRELTEQQKFSKFMHFLSLGYNFKVEGYVYGMTVHHEICIIPMIDDALDKTQPTIINPSVPELYRLAQAVPTSEYFYTSLQESTIKVLTDFTI